MRPLVDNDACHGKAASNEASSKILTLRRKCALFVYLEGSTKRGTGRVHLMFLPLWLTTG